MRKLMIAPSVGCCDLFHVEEQVKLINEKSDYLHMDIKDGRSPYGKTSSAVS